MDKQVQIGKKTQRICRFFRCLTHCLSICPGQKPKNIRWWKSGTKVGIMRLEFVHFIFKFRQSFFRNIKKIRTCRRILSGAKAIFVGYSYALSHNKTFHIGEEGTKILTPPEVVLSIVRSIPSGFLYRTLLYKKRIVIGLKWCYIKIFFSKKWISVLIIGFDNWCSII